MLNTLTEQMIATLSDTLGAQSMRPASDTYLSEPRGRWQGQAGCIVAPRDAEAVAQVVRFAADHRVAVVPFGGGTGLVGGQTQPDGPAPILLSLERMTAIRAVHPEENVLVAEAGAILADVQAAAEAADRLFPLSLASEGSCRIGGNLATNAGGVNVLRYGNARELCLGLEAVLPNGELWRGARRLRKDNTGYDLRNLLIGAEGTLGVITAASLRLFPRPARHGTALMVVEDPAAALSLLSIAQGRAEGGVSAFELMSGVGLHFLARTGLPVRQPFETPPEWMVLIDLGLSAGQDPTEILGAIFEAGVEAGLVSDGLIASSEAQRADLWAIRETIPEANKRIGAIVSNDISLPLGHLAEFIARAPGLLARHGDVRVNCFGHLGDGNLHYNIFPADGQRAADMRHLADDLRATVDALVAEFDGSFSAEHGVGRLKVDALERYGDPAKLAAMRAIKAALDPLGIMNPGAVLRA